MKTIRTNRTPNGPADDARVTAYALGELEGDVLAAFERELRHSPQLRAAVEETRELAATLSRELSGAGPELLSEQRSAILETARREMGPALETAEIRRVSLRALAAGIGLAAAAAGLFLVARPWGPAHAPVAERLGQVVAKRASEPGPAARASANVPEERAAQPGPGTELRRIEPDTTAPNLVANAAQPGQGGAPHPIEPLAMEPTIAPSELAPRSEQGTLEELGYVAGPSAPAAGQPVSGGSTVVVGLASDEEDPGAGRELRPYRGPSDTPAPTLGRRSLDGGTLVDAPSELSREAYAHTPENAFVRVADDPLSTFSIDVDTASYANVRRFLRGGTLPPPDAVRIEELVNYFAYSDAPPLGPEPFAIHTEVAQAPWAPEHLLLRIGLKGRELGDLPSRPRNLTFLIDVSGSMQPANKLPLLKRAMRLLVDQLTAADRVAIVVYAGSSGLVLPPTACSEKAAILEALERLEAGGSTAGAAGIELAYRTAQESFIEGGINRVILATDGDFNVGVSDEGSLVRLIEEKRKAGVFLSVLGFGTGNLQDSKMEQLADHGNGNYAYIDSLREAQKVLVRELGGTLETIAKDVKIQVEFNPREVAAFRLIGYENRKLAHADFNDDTKDAGEIGAGHSVVALYEIVPAGLPVEGPSVDPLKYQEPERVPSNDAFTGELLTVKLRYKDPEGSSSHRIERPVRRTSIPFEAASEDFRFAASVAAFGMLLRGSEHCGDATLEDVLGWTAQALGPDPYGYRTEFLDLVDRAERLKNQR